MTDEREAMQSVLEEMGQAARAAKAKMLAPKPTPAPAAPPAPEVSEGPSEAELQALLGS